MSELYYRAETEAGTVIDDPSEDSIFDLLGKLDLAENTFVTIEHPDEKWYVSITRASAREFEIVYKDPATGEHRIERDRDRGRIAKDVTIWLGRTWDLRHANEPG